VPQETSVTIAAKTPYPQDLTKDPLARRPRTTTPTTNLGHHRHQDSLPAGPDQGCDGKEAKEKTPTTTTPSTPSTPTMTTPSMTQRQPTSSPSFHLITPQSRRKPEPTWKTLKMLRKKKQGTRYPSTTGKTHSTLPPTPRMTTHLLPPTATITPDHDFVSDDRNDDFDAVHRNHAFDNDFDLDMHEPGD